MKFKIYIVRDNRFLQIVGTCKILDRCNTLFFIAREECPTPTNLASVSSPIKRGAIHKWCFSAFRSVAPLQTWCVALESGYQALLSWINSGTYCSSVSTVFEQKFDPNSYIGDVASDVLQVKYSNPITLVTLGRPAYSMTDPGINRSPVSKFGPWNTLALDFVGHERYIPGPDCIPRAIGP